MRGMVRPRSFAARYWVNVFCSKTYSTNRNVFGAAKLTIGFPQSNIYTEMYIYLSMYRLSDSCLGKDSPGRNIKDQLYVNRRTIYILFVFPCFPCLPSRRRNPWSGSWLTRPMRSGVWPGRMEGRRRGREG